MQSVSQLASV